MLERLRAYVGEHGIVPSLSVLARLWGYSSKASSARIVNWLVEDGALVRAPEGRLRPGPTFLADSREMDLHDRIASRWKDCWSPHALAEAYDLSIRVTRVAQAMNESSRRTAARNGLTVGELLVLDVLYRMGPPFRCAPTALKHHFALTLPGVGKRIANLHRQGLIDRVSSQEDRRSRLVQLNEKGRKRLEKAAEMDLESPHIQWAMGLGRAARATLIDTLRHALIEIEAPRRTTGNKQPESGIARYR